MMAFITTSLAYLSLGAIAGLMSGLLGVGGGLLVVPGLAFIFAYYHLFDSSMIMRVAAASSLAAMMVTTLFALRAHASRGIQFWHVFRLFLPGMVVGVVIGSLVASFLHSDTLRILFGLFVLTMALNLFLQKKIHAPRKLPAIWMTSIVGFLIGLLSGTLGIGGSTLIIPYLIFYNIPMRNAITIAAASGLAMAMVGTCAFVITGLHVDHLPDWSSGYVYWPAVLGVVIASPWFAIQGASLSHRLPVHILRRIFAVFLLFIGVNMLVR